MQVEVSIEAKVDLFPPLVSQSREKWAYKYYWNLKPIITWRQIGPDKVLILLTGDSERFPVPANQSREKVI